MVHQPPFVPTFLVCALLCRVLPASGAVAISLEVQGGGNAVEAEALIADLLDAPSRLAEGELVRYRAESWSDRRDLPSRCRALAELEAVWGAALRVDDAGPAACSEAAQVPAAASVRRVNFAAAEAAISSLPASLLEGRGQAYDGLAAAGSPLVLLPAPAADQPPRPRPAAETEKRDKEFEDAIVGLIDELSIKDPVLFNKIRAEEERIRALPTREERTAAVLNGYPRLERELDRSAAQGKLSPAGAARWAVFRAQAQAALADGTLFERALFAGKTFDDKVQELLDRGTTRLDPNKKFPETKDQYMKLSLRIHRELSIAGNSTALTPRQLDRAFEIVGGEYGIRPEFLKYMAKTESGLKQVVPSNPAAVGIMQIEHVHQDAYAGPRNVANDTITNIVYGGMLRAQTDRMMAKRFAEAGIAPPSNPRVVEFLGDLAYNRGPGLLKHVARHAAEQRINVDSFGEYVGGRGGSYALTPDGKNVVVRPGPGTGIDKTGRGSVLELSSEAVGRVKFSKKLMEGLGDRNGDGRIDHLDIWLTRGLKYLREPALKLP